LRTKVLLAEDDEAFRHLVVATLPPQDYTVLEARDGDEAWALLLAYRPPLAILDIRMPGRSGLDLLRAIRAESWLANMGVILLTGATGAQDVAAGMVAGADAYLTKPFSPLQLLGTVEGLLDPTRLTRDASTRLYWALVEALPDALLVVEAERRQYVVANAAAERLLGWPRAALLRMTPQDLTPPEDGPARAPALAILDATGAFTGSWRMVRADGKIITADVQAARVDVAGRTYYQGVFRARGTT
jgi:PAS domain S-box-containing protein